MMPQEHIPLHDHASSSKSAESHVALSTDRVSRGEAHRQIAALREQFPSEHAYLRRLQGEAQRLFPDYGNINEAVYMQIDGEYFAVKWPRCVRVVHDAAINVLQGACGST